MKRPGYWIHNACLLLAISCSGCGSSSSFFRIRNPFDIEAEAIASHRDRSNREQPRPGSGIEKESAGVPEPDLTSPRATPYFGRETTSGPAFPLLSKKEEPTELKQATAEAVIPPPPVPLSRQETVAVPRPAATGAPCYRCNGKGNHLSSLAQDARMVECADCSGTGRR